MNGANVYAFRANCSYRRHFESWFHADRATPGRIHEMESYHGMLACVIAGAGLALIPRSMLESMPGHQQVSAAAGRRVALAHHRWCGAGAPKPASWRRL